MNILILDPNILHANSIIKLLKKIELDFDIDVCKNVDEAIVVATSKIIDLFIIEIKLENSSGFKFAIQLRKHKKYKMAWILFVTSDGSYEQQAYEYIHCFHYFIKPYNPMEFIDVVQNLINYEIREKSIVEKLSFEYKNQTCNIEINSILFIEINYKLLRINTIYKSYDFNRISLNSILAKLPTEYFIRCHKSFVVNKSHVKSLNYINSKLMLDIGTTKIPIGGEFKENIMSIFSN